MEEALELPPVLAEQAAASAGFVDSRAPDMAAVAEGYEEVFVPEVGIHDGIGRSAGERVEEDVQNPGLVLPRALEEELRALPVHSVENADGSEFGLAGDAWTARCSAPDFGSTAALADVDLQWLEGCDGCDPSALAATSCADAIVLVGSVASPAPCSPVAASEVEVAASEAAMCFGAVLEAEPGSGSTAALAGAEVEGAHESCQSLPALPLLDAENGCHASLAEEIPAAGSPRSSGSSRVANSGASWLRWPVNAQVERLLDDVSDIWIGAIISAVYPGDVYDITYIDDGTLETNVDGCELRGRKLSLPGDIWSRTCSFLSDPLLLCFVEESSTEARRTLVEYSEELWCVAYHCHFGRCGPLCSLPNRPHTSPTEVGLAAQVAVECAVKVADPRRAERQRRPWKVKFAERHQDDKKKLLELECPALAAQLLAGDDDGSPTGAFIDDRMRFGRNALRGMYFDQVLGQMVREDGGPEHRVVISRGRTTYTF